MKTKLLNMISIVMILVLATACGGDASSTKTDEVQNSSVTITVEKPSEQNVYFSKTSNVDLKIVSMKIDVYKTDNVEDDDISNKNTFLSSQPLNLDASQWKGTLTGLEKESIYIFDIIAKNISDQVIFGGRTTKKIATGVSNDVDIKLTQSTNLFTNADSIPTVSNLLATKDANGKIALSFNIINPNEESVTWKLFKADGTTLSTEFSVNTGTTSNVSEAVSVNYTKDINANNTNYILALTSSEGEIRYTFSIDFEGETVSVTVNTPPIIKSVNIVVKGDQLTITPVLDKESSAVTYAWSFISSNNEVLTNPSDKIVVITGYNENSDFRLMLKVLENGSSSYRVYRIRGDVSSNVKLIDTSKQEVLDVLGISKVEADALLALYTSTNMASNSKFDTWNTLTSVNTWIGVSADSIAVGGEINIKELDLSSSNLTGRIPSELGKLSKLLILNLSNNQLTGRIPTKLGNLGNLMDLYLNNNQLTGSIPLSFIDLESLDRLYINDNPLKAEISYGFFKKFLNNLDTFKFTNTQLTITGVTSD